MSIPTLHLGDKMSREVFLDDYWQKRPVLLRAAIDPTHCQLAPDELAGLACDEEVESRLVQQQSDTDWLVRNGPLSEHDFTQLPDSHWTLLVQDADKHVPEVAHLLDAFDFLPDWRLDDIMISYATDQGGVGPHTDNYDVFLVQAQGQRRWRLSYRHYDENDLLPDCPLRVLKTFRTDEDWVLDPGDVLYLPPGVAHWGTAAGECMTWSIGLRGVSDTELSLAWLEQFPLYEGRSHMKDSVHSEASKPALLSDRDIRQASGMIQNMAPKESPEFRLWLARYLTEPKPGFEITREDVPGNDIVERWLAGNIRLHRHPWARLAMVELDRDRLALCAQGEALVVPRTAQDTIEHICQHRSLDITQFQNAAPLELREILSELLQRGWICIDDE